MPLSSRELRCGDPDLKYGPSVCAGVWREQAAVPVGDTLESAVGDGVAVPPAEGEAPQAASALDITATARSRLIP
jgi:hypothetical protein